MHRINTYNTVGAGGGAVRARRGGSSGSRQGKRREGRCRRAAGAADLNTVVTGRLHSPFMTSFLTLCRPMINPKHKQMLTHLNIPLPLCRHLSRPFPRRCCGRR